MPCRDYHDPPGNALYGDFSGWTQLQQINAQQKQRLDLLTKMLCEACSVLERMNELPDNLVEWWEQHKKDDQSK